MEIVCEKGKIKREDEERHMHEEFAEKFLRIRDGCLEPQESYRQRMKKLPRCENVHLKTLLEDMSEKSVQEALIEGLTVAAEGVRIFYSFKKGDYTLQEFAQLCHTLEAKYFLPLRKKRLVSPSMWTHEPNGKEGYIAISLFAFDDLPPEIQDRCPTMEKFAEKALEAGCTELHIAQPTKN